MLNPDAVDLEEAFFADQNARLLEKLRQKKEHAEKREALRQVVGIDDDGFLDRLIDLGIGPERAMVLRLTPLVFVAWADGEIDKREREAILKAATKQGIAAEGIAKEVLGDWLERKPEAKILEMWKEYIAQVWTRFTPDERQTMRENLLSATREVAQSAGGFLGLKSISPAEQKMLDELESVVR